jgi:hypothetical protein
VDQTRRAPGAPLIAFLLVAFAVVGLVGLVASSTAPVPLAREAAREITLDAALETAGDSQALQRLLPALDDSADAVLHGSAPLAQRVAAERRAMRIRFQDQEEALQRQLRLMIVAITATAGAFGVGMMFAAQRG